MTTMSVGWGWCDRVHKIVRGVYQQPPSSKESKSMVEQLRGPVPLVRPTVSQKVGDMMGYGLSLIHI